VYAFRTSNTHYKDPAVSVHKSQDCGYIQKPASTKCFQKGKMELYYASMEALTSLLSEGDTITHIHTHTHTHTHARAHAHYLLHPEKPLGLFPFNPDFATYPGFLYVNVLMKVWTVRTDHCCSCLVVRRRPVRLFLAE
jgi:hypothetical protein